MQSYPQINKMPKLRYSVLPNCFQFQEIIRSSGWSKPLILLVNGAPHTDSNRGPPDYKI